jgi:hypothetical protein
VEGGTLMARVTFDFPFEVGDTDLVELGVMESKEGSTTLEVPQERLAETLEALALLGFHTHSETA